MSDDELVMYTFGKRIKGSTADEGGDVSPNKEKGWVPRQNHFSFKDLVAQETSALARVLADDSFFADIAKIQRQTDYKPLIKDPKAMLAIGAISSDKAVQSLKTDVQKEKDIFIGTNKSSQIELFENVFLNQGKEKDTKTTDGSLEKPLKKTQAGSKQSICRVVQLVTGLETSVTEAIGILADTVLFAAIERKKEKMNEEEKEELLYALIDAHLYHLDSQKYDYQSSTDRNDTSIEKKPEDEDSSFYPRNLSHNYIQCMLAIGGIFDLQQAILKYHDYSLDILYIFSLSQVSNVLHAKNAFVQILQMSIDDPDHFVSREASLPISYTLNANDCIQQALLNILCWMDCERMCDLLAPWISECSFVFHQPENTLKVVTLFYCLPHAYLGHAAVILLLKDQIFAFESLFSSITSNSNEYEISTFIKKASICELFIMSHKFIFKNSEKSLNRVFHHHEDGDLSISIEKLTQLLAECKLLIPVNQHHVYIRARDLVCRIESYLRAIRSTFSTPSFFRPMNNG